MPSMVGKLPNCRECMSCTVSGFRICAFSYFPSCKCASIKYEISTAVIEELPAGAGSMNSKSFAGSDATV